MAKRDFFSRQLQSMAPHRAMIRAIECRFMSQVPLVHPVLDIGSGDGHFASIAFDEPLDLGIDVRWNDLKESLSRSGVYRQLALADATSLPCPTGAFNTVLSNCVIEHIPNLDSLLREVHRVLAPGGTFAATVPSQYFTHFLLGHQLFHRARMPALGELYGQLWNRNAAHYHLYSPEQWRERLAAAGLEMVSNQYYLSEKATQALELSHYLGVPMLLTRLLLGRWVVAPVLMRPYEIWLRRYYEEELPAAGGCFFFLARRPV